MLRSDKISRMELKVLFSEDPADSVDSALPRRSGRPRSVLDRIARRGSRRRGRSVTSGISSDPDVHGTASRAGNSGCNCGSRSDSSRFEWGRGDGSQAVGSKRRDSFHGCCREPGTRRNSLVWGPYRLLNFIVQLNVLLEAKRERLKVDAQ
jgi:hypothetical protein